MYIAFEGIDGSGKTTAISIICDVLTKLNYTVIRLEEPTYGKFGQEIRKQMKSGHDVGKKKQYKLFTQDRREHVEHKIKPALSFVEKSPHFILVQDRCYISASAYQSQNDEELCVLLGEQRKFAPSPDWIFLLDLPVEVALRRIVNSGAPLSLFEKASMLENVRRRYLLLAHQSSEKIEVIDATQDPSTLCAQVLRTIELPPVV